MSGISKRVSDSWVSGDYGIMKTSTDTIATLPAIIYPNDTTATVGLKGNMQQTGTPSPSNPIQPQETGDRTGNLFDADRWYGAYKQADGTYQTNRNTWYSLVAKPFTNDDIGKSFCFAADVVPSSGNARFAAVINGVQINGQYIGDRCKVSFTVQTIDDKIIFDYGSGSTTITTVSNIMLNTGPTALPYEPHGVKIPILSASTTTPVYLGEVETTRKIKKLVLTGEETSYMAIDTSKNIFSIRGVFNQAPELLQVGGFCTHYKYNNTISSLSQNMSNGDFVLNKIADDYSFTIRDNSFSNDTDFKQYVQQQYANGTPVTVFYVLANETTGIVNEPIRKIGTYADEVSGITIPTIARENSFDVLTTLKPSEVTVNYKGWHDATVEEWDGSQWQ